MKRRALLLLAITIFSAIWSISAQETALILTRGVPASNTLDSVTPSRIYFFVATSDENIGLSITPSEGLTIGALVMDKNGTTLGQTLPDETGNLQLATVKIPATDTYYVVVFSTDATGGSYEVVLVSDGAGASAQATPETTAEVVSTPQFGVQPTPMGQVAATEAGSQQTFTPSTQILLANGIDVRLVWSAPVDLNLEVRDPLGNTLYFDRRTSPIGGNFGFDANGFCQIISANPVENATWTPGFLPTGSYEILVFYRQACQTPEAVSFTVNVTVNGVALDPIAGSLNPPLPNQQSVYLASFRVLENASASVSQGGVYPDSSLNIVTANINDIRANARTIVANTPTTGAIVGTQSYLAYGFTAQENDLVSVSHDAVVGNLDPLLQVIDSNGNLIAVNDDSPTSRNSLIQNLRIANAGQYYLIATRYGKELGGTEGEFSLNLQTGVATIPPEVQSLNLTAGDLQFVLTWATNADLQLLVRDPFGESVFDDKPNVTSGGVLGLNGNVNCVRANGTPASYVYWPSGLVRPGNYEVEVWYQSDCGDTTAVEFVLTVLLRGQIITVERQRPIRDQKYVLTVSVNPDNSALARVGGYATNDAQSVNYQAEAASPIGLGQPIIGTITNENVFDVYSFQGIAGQRVTISMASTSPTLDTKLFLIAPSGIQVAENDDSGAGSITGRRSDALIGNYVLAETGEYKVIATRYATVYGGTIGGYSLTVQGN